MRVEEMINYFDYTWPASDSRDQPFKPTAAEYRLVGYETRTLKREDFNNDKVDAGEVGSGHAVTAIYEITPVGSKAKLIDERRYAEREAAAAEQLKYDDVIRQARAGLGEDPFGYRAEFLELVRKAKEARGM